MKKLENEFLSDIACPKCQYLDPFLIQLQNAGKLNEMKGRGHTCPNCGHTFQIPDDRPLYWGTANQTKKKKHKAG